MFKALLIILHFSTISCEYPSRYVTYGSAVKLKNVYYKVRLHSHDVKYSCGSKQQSVTGVRIEEDAGSHWLVKPSPAWNFHRGQLHKCGDVLRLEHLNTGKNLHTHDFKSPLSDEQEISAFGVDGSGDQGDYWKLQCSGDYWTRGSYVTLEHVSTGVYLAATGRTYGDPIDGHHEVVGVKSQRAVTWIDEEGLYVHPSENHYKWYKQQNIHDEL